MLRIFKELPNEGPPSRISEVCFHPDGELFGATYQQADEVRLYETRSMALVRVLRNPCARLNVPHGLLITRKHIIVSNKGVFPSQFSVFRLDDESGRVERTYTTPFSHLAEAHSIALDGRRLVVSYCEGAGKKGAVVSYNYDDNSGEIKNPIDIHEAWFRRNGDAKGVSFDGTGQRVFLTFQSDFLGSVPRAARAVVINALSRGRFGRTSRNGIVAFGIDPEGRFTRQPIWAKVVPEFCRLENIHIHGGRAVVTNADSGRVYIYDLCKSEEFAEPSEMLSKPLVFPHGAKFSPDGKMLVVTDNGIEVVNHKVAWERYVSPRMDRLIVFSRQPSEAPV